MRIFINNFIKVKDFRREKMVMLFTFIYILTFSYYSFIRGNIEFVFYSFLLLLFLNVGIYIHKKVQLPEFIVIGFSLFGLFHILGGNITIKEIRLYDMEFFYGIIRYDNIIHIIGSSLVALVLNVVFFFIVEKNQKIILPLYYFALFLMTLGTGVLNEIIELIAVIFFNAHNQVGDYFNNAVDLVFDSVGALLSILMIDFYRRYKESQKGPKAMVKKIIESL